MRAIWNSQTRKVEGASGSPGVATAPLLEAGQGDERLHEHALGHVFGIGVVAELVVDKAVHLCEIAPVEGIEGGGVSLGCLDQPPVAVEVDDAPAVPLPDGLRLHWS